MINGMKIIALCMTQVHDRVNNEFIAALNERIINQNSRLFIYATNSDLYWQNADDEGEKAVFDLINYDITDALIIFNEQIKDQQVIEKIISTSHSHNVPVITIGKYHEGCINILFDYETGFEDVVRHVFDVHKPKNVHFMGGIEGNEFSEARLAVFKKLLAENNMPYDDSMVSYGQFWANPTKEAAEKLIDSGNIPDAIICANDVMALTVTSVFRERGINVPDDCIVTGFDGIDEIKLSSPKITSCLCSYHDIAQRICELLPSCYDRTLFAADHYIVPQVLISESCGCKPIDVNLFTYLNDISTAFYRYQGENLIMSKMSARMLASRNINDLAKELAIKEIYDMICVLKKECLEEGVNPLAVSGSKSFEGDVILLFDSDDGDQAPYTFPFSDILPSLNKLLSRKIPLIFESLYFLNIPLGYVCFHYNNYENINYCKISQIVTAINNGVGGYRNMRYQNHLANHIEEMYKYDALTGLYNRMGFIREYEQIIKLQSAHGGSITFILADLDGLKYINDNFGHGEGDVAIHTVAQALKAACPEGSVCARFGGDELLGVYYGVCTAEYITERIDSYLDDFNRSSDKPYEVAASTGVYITTDNDNLDFEELIKKSDNLMYKIKSAKKAAKRKAENGG